MAKFKKDSEYPRFNSFSELRAYALKEQERLGKSDSWYFELRDIYWGLLQSREGLKVLKFKKWGLIFVCLQSDN